MRTEEQLRHSVHHASHDEGAGSRPATREHHSEDSGSRLDFAGRSFSRLVEPCLHLAVGFRIATIVLTLGLAIRSLVAVLG